MCILTIPDYKATKQVTQDKMDFSDFDFGYSPETLKKLKGTKGESTTPKFSQEMGKVKPYHSTKSSDETGTVIFFYAFIQFLRAHLKRFFIVGLDNENVLNCSVLEPNNIEKILTMICLTGYI